MNEIFFAEVELGLAQGVYLFLGYSKKDEELLKKVTEQGAMEAIGAIQGLVSYHNVNSNKVRSDMTSFILIFCLIVSTHFKIGLGKKKSAINISKDVRGKFIVQRYQLCNQ